MLARAPWSNAPAKRVKARRATRSRKAWSSSRLRAICEKAGSFWCAKASSAPIKTVIHDALTHTKKIGMAATLA